MSLVACGPGGGQGPRLNRDTARVRTS